MGLSPTPIVSSIMFAQACFISSKRKVFDRYKNKIAKAGKMTVKRELKLEILLILLPLILDN